MGLARELHMTLKQLFEHADSRELGLWMSLNRLEADERKLQDLAAKAHAIRRR